MLSNVRKHTDRVFARIAAVLEALHLTPNAVTFIALLIALAGAALIASGRFISGAIVAGVGSVLDAMDGALARRLDRVTRFGGYLDSLLDRFADGALFLAVALAYDETWIWAASFLAFLGAVGTSYAKARVYQDARPPSNAFPDLLERGERILLLLVGVGVQGIVTAAGSDLVYLPWLIVAMAVLGHVTVVQRALRARRLLDEGGSDGG